MAKVPPFPDRVVAFQAAFRTFALSLKGQTLARKSQKVPVEARKKTATRSERLSAPAIIWILEVATEPRDILCAAKNILTISHNDSVSLVARSPVFRRLASQLGSALSSLSSSSDKQGEALLLARAVAHVATLDPKQCATALGIDALSIWSHAGNMYYTKDIFAMLNALIALYYRFNGPGEPHTGALCRESADVAVRPFGDLHPSTKVSVLAVPAVAEEPLWVARLVLKVPAHPSFLNLLSVNTAQAIELGSQARIPRDDRQLILAWEAHTGYASMFVCNPPSDFQGPLR